VSFLIPVPIGIWISSPFDYCTSVLAIEVIQASIRERTARVSSIQHGAQEHSR
jgi:hypothetical protein